MNSFRFVMQGINAEIARQIALLEAGEAVEQETLHFDPASGRLSRCARRRRRTTTATSPSPTSSRSRRPTEMVEAARDALPELPAERAERYERDWGLPEETARLFAFEPELGDYFEAAGDGAPRRSARRRELGQGRAARAPRRRRSGRLAGRPRRRSPS